jgi:alpha-galactosidase
MPATLENATLQFALDPASATWSLFSRQRSGPFLEGVRTRAHYRSGRAHFQALDKWENPLIQKKESTSSPHGALQKLTLNLLPDQNGLRFGFEFAIPKEHPLLLWKLTISNRGDHPARLGRMEMLRAGFIPKRTFLPKPGILSTRYSELPKNQGVVRPHPDPGELAFFSNGWSSWSHTGAYSSNDRYRRTHLGFFAAPMWFNPSTPRPRKRGHFVSDMFGVLGDRKHRTATLVGFLSQKQHFGSLEAWTDRLYPALSLWANGDDARLDPGAEITTDWAAIQFLNLDDPDPLGPYLDAVGREHHIHHPLLPARHDMMRAAPARSHPFTGWCSWYHFFEDVTAHDVRTNLNSVLAYDPRHANDQPSEEILEGNPALHLDVIQIDDGYQSRVGDWLEFDPGFPQGVAPLASEIRAAGFTPGLWIAPFIVHPKSKLARQHPDWLLRSLYSNRPTNAGYLWDSFTYGLDLTHPPAVDYVQQVVHTAVHEWGFQYLKLDFLYAGALPGRYRDPTRTRAQVLHAGLQALRDAAGDKTTLLGCGCPLGPAIGLVDAMRIGTDIAPDWLPKYKGIQVLFRSEPNMPAARNALQNILARTPLQGRWWINDPDCLLLRENTNLSMAEVQSLATAIALTGGSLLLSDHLPEIPRERLRLAESLLPLIGMRPQVLDWFDSSTPRTLRLDLENETGTWHLLAHFNWDDKANDQTLPLELFRLDTQRIYYLRSFWDGRVERVEKGFLPRTRIPPHGVMLIALRPIKMDSPQYLGGDLHISQGLEVTHWDPSSSNIRLKISRPGYSHGHIEIRSPHTPQRTIVNHQETTWKPSLPNCYRFNLRFDKEADIEINY